MVSAIRVEFSGIKECTVPLLHILTAAIVIAVIFYCPKAAAQVKAEKSATVPYPTSSEIQSLLKAKMKDPGSWMSCVLGPTVKVDRGSIVVEFGNYFEVDEGNCQRATLSNTVYFVMSEYPAVTFIKVMVTCFSG